MIFGLLAACEHDSNIGADIDASVATSDAAADGAVQAGTCTPIGNDRLVMSAPFNVDTQSVAYVTVGGKLVGVGGLSAGKTLAFSVRNVLTQSFDWTGDQDVALTNLKYLETPSGADCDTDPPGTCKGFFAVAGTFRILQTQPRFRATFELTDLREHNDTSNTAGPSIAGMVTGCVDAEAP
jgi:hypothetical protein